MEYSRFDCSGLGYVEDGKFVPRKISVDDRILLEIKQEGMVSLEVVFHGMPKDVCNGYFLLESIKCKESLVKVVFAKEEALVSVQLLSVTPVISLMENGIEVLNNGKHALEILDNFSEFLGKKIHKCATVLQSNHGRFLVVRVLQIA